MTEVLVPKWSAVEIAQLHVFGFIDAEQCPGNCFVIVENRCICFGLILDNKNQASIPIIHAHACCQHPIFVSVLYSFSTNHSLKCYMLDLQLFYQENSIAMGFPDLSSLSTAACGLGGKIGGPWWCWLFIFYNSEIQRWNVLVFLHGVFDFL